MLGGPGAGPLMAVVVVVLRWGLPMCGQRRRRPVVCGGPFRRSFVVSWPVPVCGPQPHLSLRRWWVGLGDGRWDGPGC